MGLNSTQHSIRGGGSPEGSQPARITAAKAFSQVLLVLDNTLISPNCKPGRAVNHPYSQRLLSYLCELLVCRASLPPTLPSSKRGEGQRPSLPLPYLWLWKEKEGNNLNSPGNYEIPFLVTVRARGEVQWNEVEESPPTPSSRSRQVEQSCKLRSRCSFR